MRNHRVPLLGGSWRRAPEPQRSADPRVQRVLAGLAELAEHAPTPEPTFRRELRAQLVAITPRLVAEGEPAGLDSVPVLPSRHGATARRAATGPARAAGGASRPKPLPGHPAAGHPATGAGRTGTLALPGVRGLAVAACLLVALLALLGGSLVLSRNTVPGDALYGLKRTSERVELALDSDGDKPGDLLRFAGRRLDEARVLATRNAASASGSGLGAAALSPQTSRQIAGLLSSADGDLRTASRMLTTQAIDSANPAPLRTLTSWAPGQLAALNRLKALVGDTPLGTQVAQSTTLVDSAQARAQTLSATVGCGCLQNLPSDSLGPKPCMGAAGCLPGATAPGTAGTRSSSGSSGGSRSTSSVPGGSLPSLGLPGVGTAPTGSSGGGSSRTAPTNLLPSLPGLPLHLPSNTQTVPPVSVGSCGATVTLGGIVVGLGSCHS